MSKDPVHVAVVGAGIVGVSTAVWLQRAGLDVTLIDREGPASGTSHGNAGILAASAVIPVTEPGILKKGARMLFNPNEPLFLRWSYLPRLLPFLVPYLRNANHKDLNRIASGLAVMMHDTADQHVALAKGTPAEKYLETGDYLFAYKSRKEFEKDRLNWDLRSRFDIRFEELDASALADYQPAIGGKFELGVRCLNHGQITDPGEYTKALAGHFEENGGKLLIAEAQDIRIENGRAIGVETKTGFVEADDVVLTMGAWSGKLAKKLGAKIPLEAERGYHLEFVGVGCQAQLPGDGNLKKIRHDFDEGQIEVRGNCGIRWAGCTAEQSSI